jgi:hypothetical protein
MSIGHKRKTHNRGQGSRSTYTISTHGDTTRSSSQKGSNTRRTTTQKSDGSSYRTETTTTNGWVTRKRTQLTPSYATEQRNINRAKAKADKENAQTYKMITESSPLELFIIFISLAIFAGMFAISPGLGVATLLLLCAFAVIKVMYDAGILFRVIGFFGGMILLLYLIV